MSTVLAVSEAELRALQKRLLETISYRGTERDATKMGCLIRQLFEQYQSGAEPAESWVTIWNECWKESPLAPKGKRRRGETTDRFSTFKSTLSRVKKRVSEYFAEEGSQEQWRVVIGGSPLKMSLERNQASEQVKPSSVRAENTVGLICALRSNWFNSELIAGVERAARARGFNLVVAYSDGDLYDEERLLKDFKVRLAGTIIVPTLDEFSRAEKDLHKPFLDLIEEGHPLVFVDRRVPECDAPLVGCDNERGGWLATDYLINQCKCSHVIVFAESGSTAAKERVHAHKKYVQNKYGLEHVPDIHWPEAPEELGGYESIKGLLTQPDGDALRRDLASGKQIGLFATNDAIIRGVRAYLENPACPPLPAPLHMIGFDGRDFGSFMNPPLVSIKQDFFEIGNKALEVLVGLLGRSKTDRIRSMKEDADTLSHRTNVELWIAPPIGQS